MILFLNKTDLLEEKVPKSPISKFFPDYTGGANIEEAKKFIKEKFSEIGTVLSARKRMWVRENSELTSFFFLSLYHVCVCVFLKKIGL